MLPQQSAPLRSKPLKLATKRKRSVADYIPFVVRACMVSAMLLLSLLLVGSEPVAPLPNVESRFEDWKRTHNESALAPLPGRASEPAD